MTIHIRLTHLAIGIVAGALLAGGGYALAASRSSVIHACVNNRTHALLVESRCGHGYRSLAWNQQGPAGPRGARGPVGAIGATGANGANGTGATVSVGSVTTGAPGSQASVTNVGTASDAKLDFTIPAGATGTSGTSTGTGVTAYGQMWIGNTQAEVAPGSSTDNITNVSGGGGVATFQVSGCTEAGLQEPIITVTADKDSSDSLTGANSSAGDPVGAYVSRWSTNGDLLVVDVEEINLATEGAVNSDFSFTVIC